MVEDIRLHRDRYAAFGTSLQPSIYSIKLRRGSFFLVFDDLSWEFNSVHKVIDIAFKTYQVFNIKHQFE